LTSEVSDSKDVGALLVVSPPGRDPQRMRELLHDIKRVSAVFLSNDSGSLH
jgi:hypothetical protein